MARLPRLLSFPSSSRNSPPRYSLIDDLDSKPASRAPSRQTVSMVHSMPSVGRSMRILFFSLICLIAFFLISFMAAHERVAEQYRMMRRKRELTQLLEAQRRQPRWPTGGSAAPWEAPNDNRPPQPPQEEEPKEIPGMEFRDDGKDPKPPPTRPVPKARATDESESSLKPKKASARVFGSAFEHYWDKPNHNRIICRVHQSCLRKNGTLIVPPWLAGLDKTFKECGATSIEVMPSLSFWNSSGPLGDHDLFTIINYGKLRQMRGHIPHMATDVLAYIVSQETIRPTFTSNRTRYYSCRGDACSNRLAKEALRPAVWADDDIADAAPTAWQPQVFDKLPKTPKLANMRRIFRGKDAACFHSILTYSPTYIRLGGTHWLGPESALATYASRKSARRKRGKAAGLCRVNVILLNRVGSRRHVGYAVGREIINTRDLEDEVRKAAGAIQGIHVNMTEVFFENASFSSQVAAMQSADVLIGAHGAGLGNIMFLREQVPVVEVFPFGYYPGPFFVMAEALYLPYRSVVARPDSETFMECVRGHERRGKFPKLMEYAGRLWEQAVKRWDKGRERGLFVHLLQTPQGAPMRFCARIQRLHVDAPYTAKIVIQEVERVCGRKKAFAPQK